MYSRRQHFALPGNALTLGCGVLLLCYMLGWTSVAQANTSRWLVFGVQNYLGFQETLDRYQPMVDYLNNQLDDVAVALEVLSLEEIERGIAGGYLDIVATNPTHFLMIRQEYPLSGVIATVSKRINGHGLSHLGGVIIARSERTDLQALTDLRGQRLVAPSPAHMGGYRAPAYELYRVGIRLPQDVADIRFVGGHLDVVWAVLDGRADAGFIRTGILEDLLSSGELRPGQLRVLNRQQMPHYPFELSTRLYPEWPVFALPHVDDRLIRRFAAALFSLEPDHPAALASQIHGFTIPADYLTVEEVARTLRLAPFDAPPSLTFTELWQQYQDYIALAVLASLLGLMLIVGSLMSKNQRLREQRNTITASEARQRAVLGALGEGVYGCDLEGKATFVNPAAIKMLGFSEQEILGQDQHQLFHYQYPDGQTYPPEECPVHQTAEDGQTRFTEDWFWRKNGSGFPVSLVVTPLIEHGQRTGSVVVFCDITLRKEAERELRKLSMVVEQSPDSILITDLKGRIEYVNRACQEKSGYSAEQLLGSRPSLLQSGKTPPETYAALWSTLQAGQVWRGELINRRQDGNEYIELATLGPVRSPEGQITHYFGIQQDISQLRQAEEQIHRLANFDHLTHLPNRTLLMERLAHCLATLEDASNRYVLILINLDRFKNLNHARGQGFGDKVLHAVAERLQSGLEAQDMLARLSADDFAVLIHTVFICRETAHRAAMHLVEHLHTLIRATFDIQGETVSLTASLGVTLLPEEFEYGGRDTVQHILRRAGTALHRAKHAGGNQTAFFETNMGETAQHNFQIEHELRKAVSRNELRLFLQPQVNTRSEIIAFEALLRWQHPVRGLLPPGVFIQVAEESDLIVELGAWVFEQACTLQAQQQLRGRTLDISINLSPRQFRQPQFVDWVTNLLQATGADPRHIMLEVTENLMIHNVDEVIDKMNALCALGLRFSVDDFGTGYSSLVYLKRLPIHELKIDQGFIRDAPEDSESAALVDTILTVARNLKLQVVAEGVETEAHAAFLRERGDMIHQGYLYGRPAPAEEWLRYQT